MQAWNSRLSAVAIVAASALVLSSTGCKSSGGGGLAKVPGMGWLNRNREEAPPTMLAENDPTGHLPPPSAVADPYSPDAVASTRGSGSASYGSQPASKGYPSTDYTRDSLAQNESRSYQTGPYNTGPVASESASPRRNPYSAEPTPDPYGSRDLPSSASRELPADRWSQQTAADTRRGMTEPRDPGGLPPRGYANDSSTPGPSEPDRYAAAGSSYGDRYEGEPSGASGRASSYPGSAGSAPSAYYGQAPAYGGDLDRSVASAPEAAPYARRDLTANPYDDGSGVRVADHRADAQYDTRQTTPEYGGSARLPERSTEPWRPGSTGDYMGSESNADAGRYQSSPPARDSDYNSYTR